MAVADRFVVIERATGESRGASDIDAAPVCEAAIVAGRFVATERAIGERRGTIDVEAAASVTVTVVAMTGHDVTVERAIRKLDRGAAIDQNAAALGGIPGCAPALADGQIGHRCRAGGNVEHAGLVASVDGQRASAGADDGHVLRNRQLAECWCEPYDGRQRNAEGDRIARAGARRAIPT